MRGRGNDPMSKWPPFCRKLKPWFELTGRGQRQQWDGKHIKDWLDAHQPWYLYVIFLSGWWVVRFMVSEGVGIFGRWPPSHRFSGFLSGECPSRWDDHPRPVILRHVGDAMAIIRSTRVQKLASWACSDQNKPQTQSAQAKACQWSCPWSLPCSGFGFNFHFRGNWNHGFDSEILNQNRNQNHGFNFPKMFLAAEFCGFN